MNSDKHGEGAPDEKRLLHETSELTAAESSAPPGAKAKLEHANRGGPRVSALFSPEVLEELGTLLSTVEAAAALGLHERTLRHCVQRGELPIVQCGPRTLVHPADLLAFVHERLQRPVSRMSFPNRGVAA